MEDPFEYKLPQNPSAANLILASPYYPHITERIIEYLPYGELRRLRKVSSILDYHGARRFYRGSLVDRSKMTATIEAQTPLMNGPGYMSMMPTFIKYCYLHHIVTHPWMTQEQIQGVIESLAARGCQPLFLALSDVWSTPNTVVGDPLRTLFVGPAKWDISPLYSGRLRWARVTPNELSGLAGYVSRAKAVPRYRSIPLIHKPQLTENGLEALLVFWSREPCTKKNLIPTIMLNHLVAILEKNPIKRLDLSQLSAELVVNPVGLRIFTRALMTSSHLKILNLTTVVEPRFKGTNGDSQEETEHRLPAKLLLDVPTLRLTLENSIKYGRLPFPQLRSIQLQMVTAELMTALVVMLTELVELSIDISAVSTHEITEIIHIIRRNMKKLMHLEISTQIVPSIEALSQLTKNCTDIRALRIVNATNLNRFEPEVRGSKICDMLCPLSQLSYLQMSFVVDFKSKDLTRLAACVPKLVCLDVPWSNLDLEDIMTCAPGGARMPYLQAVWFYSLTSIRPPREGFGSSSRLKLYNDFPHLRIFRGYWVERGDQANKIFLREMVHHLETWWRHIPWFRHLTPREVLGWTKDELLHDGVPADMPRLSSRNPRNNLPEISRNGSDFAWYYDARKDYERSLSNSWHIGIFRNTNEAKECPEALTPFVPDFEHKSRPLKTQQDIDSASSGQPPGSASPFRSGGGPSEGWNAPPTV